MRELLNFSGGRVTPLVLQTESTECGLACLAMVAGHHGDKTRMAVLRREHPVSLKGATLSQLLQCARLMRLAPRAVKVEIADLRKLALPAILHWDFNHFVVLARVRKGRYTIHDPARGACELNEVEVGRHLTGVGVELAPTPEFRRHDGSERVSVLDLFGRLYGIKATVAQILALAVALELLAVLSPLLMQWVVDQGIVAADRDLLAVLGLGFLLLVAVQVGITGGRAWVVMVLGTTLNMQALSGLFAHLVRLPMSYFHKRHLGDVSSRFESLGVIQRTLTVSFFEAILDGGMALVTLAVMAAYSASLTGLVVAAAGLYAALRITLSRPLMQAQNEQIVHSARQQSNFLETVRGIQSVKLFNRQHQRVAAHSNLLADNVNAGIRVQRLKITYAALQGALFGVENVAVIWLGATMVLDGALTVGMLFAFLAFKHLFVARFGAFVDKGIDFFMLGLHAERVGDIALTEPEAELGRAAASAAGLQASIELREVSFRYSEFEPPILDRVSFRIEAGESVAIVGPSGCGKTTLLKVILGLLQPTAGEVLVGGVNIARLGPDYRDLIGTVMQDDELFAGSIEENISFFDLDADRERVEACARQAALHADIRAMPMGYNTFVGDMGSVLSGGQKQRLLLARALYKQPRILALDEATSHLDVERERSVNEAVRAMQLTRIVIAHRAETIRMAGRVIALWERPPAEPALRQIVNLP